MYIVTNIILIIINRLPLFLLSPFVILVLITIDHSYIHAYIYKYIYTYSIHNKIIQRRPKDPTIELWNYYFLTVERPLPLWFWGRARSFVHVQIFQNFFRFFQISKNIPFRASEPWYNQEKLVHFTPNRRLKSWINYLWQPRLIDPRLPSTL